MDRSFLSNQQVVAASREFVCIRMATYEDAEEAKVHMRVFRGRDGLENSVFGILDPTGQRLLSRGARSPSQVFADAEAMAQRMKRIAKRYPGRDADVGLPWLEDARIGLNVAAADSQQLVIVYGEGEELARAEAELAKLAWSDGLAGRFLYARAEPDADTDDGPGFEWDTIAGSAERGAFGMLIVQPGEFGIDGKVVKRLDLDNLLEDLLAASKTHSPKAVDTRTLRRKGIRRGVRWQSELPVTDKRGPRR
ncbi:MAG: hypothetical protein NXI31_16590 [bacterium]|nr:hypothetical protein [bacterium]